MSRALVALVLSCPLVLGCMAQIGATPPGWTDADGGAPVPSGPECGPELPACPEGSSCVSTPDGLRCQTDRPPGDGTDCGFCPAPGECRAGACVQPSPGGAVCEFDPECGEGFLCIAGRCTPDPRVPRTCAEPGSRCVDGTTCLSTGTCGCVHDAECPIGLVCMAGTCGTPPGGCVADAECPGAHICEAGACIDPGVCDITHPDLAGVWEMRSVLRFREALPPWLSGLLDTLEGPFRFLAGEAACFDMGLPGFVEDAICREMRPVADSLPPYVRAMFGAIADLNVVLSTWDIDERMTLRAGGLDEYDGTHEWLRIRFTSRDTMIVADPTTVFDWRFEPEPFDATATCGTFNIARHDVSVSIGAIIAWLVDAVVYESTDGRYADLESALRGASSGFCPALASAAASLFDSSIAAIVRVRCDDEIDDLIGDAVSAVRGARLDTDPITLRGHAPITGPRSLRPGRWDGTLLGSSFSGDFDAWR